MKTLCMCIVMFAAARTSAEPERVRHVPTAEADAGKPLELVAVASATVPRLVLHYRTAGAAAYAVQELARKDGGSWVAVVPAEQVAAPGLEYYLDAGGTPVFASAEVPHTTRVATTEDTYRRRRDEARTSNRRSRFHSLVEYVDYGKPSTGLDDRYYRIDADFSYRLWAYPLDTLQVGYTRLIGVKETAAGTANADAGFKVAGWVGLGLVPIDGVGLDARGMVMATQDGFAVGGRGELWIGVRDGTHVATGIEYLADVGTNGFFRFGWGTVPNTPMAATVEISKLPARSGEVGVRLYYDLTRQLSDLLRLGVRVGYASRDSDSRGFTGGAQAMVDF